jgi:hypothetical protein
MKLALNEFFSNSAQIRYEMVKLWMRRFVHLHGMPPLRAAGIGRKYLK